MRGGWGPRGSHVRTGLVQRLLSFTALRLEYGWLKAPVTAPNLAHLKYARRREERLDEIADSLLH